MIKKILQVAQEGDGEAALTLLQEIVVEYASGAPADEAPADPTAAASDPPVPTEEEQAMSALSRDVVALVGAKSAGEAATRVKEIVAAHAETEARARTLEQSERRALVANLVKIGAETPATAWENADAEGEARTPRKRLADEPIAELRSRVEALSKANPRVRIAPPVSQETEGAKPLTAQERAYCAKHSMSEVEFRAKKDSVVRRNK
jgi:hypothetical protein